MGLLLIAEKYLFQQSTRHVSAEHAAVLQEKKHSDLGTRAITCWFKAARQAYPPSAWTGS